MASRIVDRQKLDAFTEALAETGSVVKASAACGVSKQRGTVIFRRVRNEIDGPQLAAGFGAWAR